MKKIIIILLVVVLFSCSKNVESERSYRSSISDVQKETEPEKEQEENVEQQDEIKEDSKEIEEAQEDEESSEEEVGENVIRDDVKSAIDSYEAFIDEYCEFMKRFSENSSDISMLLDYAQFMSKYTDMSNEFEALEKDLTLAETNYYIQVMNRCNQKMLEIIN